MNDLLVQVYNAKPHPLNSPDKGNVEVAMETTSSYVHDVPQSSVRKRRKQEEGEEKKKLKKRRKNSMDKETGDALKEKHLQGQLIIINNN